MEGSITPTPKIGGPSPAPKITHNNNQVDEFSQMNQPDYLKLPNEESFDKTALNLLKVVRKLIGESFESIATEFNRKVLEETSAVQLKLEDKITEVTQQCNYIQKRQEPLMQLLTISESGKSLPESITSYVTQMSITPMINQFRDLYLPQYLLNEDFKKSVDHERRQTISDINTVRQSLFNEIDNVRKKSMQSDIFERFRYETTLQIEEIQRKEFQMDGNLQTHEEKLFSLSESLGKKADSERVWELKEQLHDYAKKEAVTKLQQELLDLATKDALEDTKYEFRQKINEVKKVVDTHISREEVDKTFKEINERLKKEIQIFHKISDFKEFVTENETKLQKIQEQFVEVEEKFKGNDQDVVSIKQQISTKAENTDLLKHIEKSKKFAFKAELKELEFKIFPTIENFKREMNEFKVEREQHSQILFRYDEVITEKASKHMVAELREDIYKIFARQRHLDDLNEKLLKQVEFTEKMKQDNEVKFDAINKAITIEIYNAVKKAIKQMQHIVTKAQEDQENKSKGMNKDLMNMISQKATYRDIEHINQTKANKVDTEQLLDSLAVVHRQLKQALVLIIESIKSDIDSPNESAQSKENKQKFLINQLGFLARWVISYEPVSYNHTEMGEGFKFLEQVEGKALQEYTDSLINQVAQIQHKNLGSIPVNFKNLRFTSSRGSGHKKRPQNYSQTHTQQITISSKNDSESHNFTTLNKTSALSKINSGTGGINSQLYNLKHGSPVNINSSLSFLSNTEQSQNMKNFMTIDRDTLKAQIKNNNFKIQTTRASPQLETTPTSPLLRESLQKSNRILRETPKVPRAGQSVNDLYKSADVREKKTIDLPPLV